MRKPGEPGAKTQGILDEKALEDLQAAHPEGFTSAQVVHLFLERGVKLSEATFRKWVQLGLLPRSRRVGRKGKHQGSLGLYPPATLARIAEIKRLMAENLTIEDIQRAHRFRDEIATIEHSIDVLFGGLDQAIATSGEEAAVQRESRRLLGEARKSAGEFIRRTEILERRIVTPLVREAKARAFGAGARGGAGDLL